MDTPEGPETFSDGDALVVRRNPWILGLAASPLLFALGALGAAVFLHASYLALVIHPAIVGLVAPIFAFRRNYRPIIEPRPVHADASGITLGDRRIPRSEIRAGFVLPTHPPRVILRRRWALPIELQVRSTSEGRALLRALGLDVSQSVATFRTPSRAVAKRRHTAAGVGFFFAMYGYVLVGPGGLAPVASIGFMLAVALLIVVMLMPTKLSVGADGLVVRWFGRSRFIAHGEIAEVTRYDKGWGRSRQIGLAVTLRSGEEILLPIGQSRWGDENVGVVEERIREALETFRSGGVAADAALLRRGGREVADWVSALRAIGAGANADMRTAPLPRDRLFRIVESPTAGASERAAAAVALGGDLDDDVRRRLRVAAEAIAAPKLRFAVEAAAGGGETAEMEAALAEVEEEAAETKA